MRRASLFVVLLAAVLASSIPRLAAACSCTNNLTLQQEFDYASVVFSGRVLAIEPDPFGTLVVVLAPLQRWKGPLWSPQRIVTGVDPGVCGFPFTVGEDYLVFANGGSYGVAGHAEFTHLCSRTILLADCTYLSQLPPPLATTPAVRSSWCSIKLFYR